MHDKNGKPCSILPLIPDQPTSPSAETQQEALDTVLHEFVAAMERAERDPDPWASIRIMANAEKILGIYCEEGFTELQEFRDELKSDLRKVWRMARRQHIKRALLSPPDEFQHYLADMHGLDGPNALDDFHAVEAHLDLDQPLNEGLLKRQRN